VRPSSASAQSWSRRAAACWGSLQAAAVVRRVQGQGRRAPPRPCPADPRARRGREAAPQVQEGPGQRRAPAARLAPARHRPRAALEGQREVRRDPRARGPAAPLRLRLRRAAQRLRAAHPARRAPEPLAVQGAQAPPLQQRVPRAQDGPAPVVLAAPLRQRARGRLQADPAQVAPDQGRAAPAPVRALAGRALPAAAQALLAAVNPAAAGRAGGPRSRARSRAASSSPSSGRSCWTPPWRARCSRTWTTSRCTAP
jgi:hypothetical protein